jgi:hypothetical protein
MEMALVERTEARREIVPEETFWTDARVVHLYKLLQDGCSYAAMAVAIGDGCTKSMALGKVRRMKWQREPQARPERKGTTLIVPICKSVPLPEPAREPLTESACTISGLTNRTCRYPLWGLQAKESERFYCGESGADVLAGRPYCDRHMELCVVPIPLRRR